MSNAHVLCFKAIASFVGDLNEVFGELEPNRPLKLYYKILEQITFTHQVAIEKNIAIFKKFIQANELGILKKDFSLFNETKLVYSEKAFIDFEYIFENAKNNVVEEIWPHLLTIMAIINPESKARELLSEMRALTRMDACDHVYPNTSSSGSETAVISNLVSKIQKHVNLENSANPMDVVLQMMQSGAFNEIVQELSQSMQNGEIDIAGLVSSLGQFENVETD